MLIAQTIGDFGGKKEWLLVGMMISSCVLKLTAVMTGMILDILKTIPHFKWMRGKVGQLYLYIFNWSIIMLIKPVNPKGNKPWTFIGRTDVEAEAPIFWPPDAKSRFTGKDPNVGKDWRQKEKGTTEDEMVGWHHRLNGAKPGRQWRTGKPGMLQSMGSQQRVGHDWATERQQLCLFQVQSKVIPWYTYTPTLFQILFPYKLLQNIEYYSVCYTVGPCWLSILYIVACVRCVYTQYVLDKSGDFLEPHCPLSVQWLWMRTTVYMPSILHRAV